MKAKKSKSLVGIIMGSKSDHATMKHAADIFKTFKIPYEINIVSAHRTPKLLYDYATGAEDQGLKVIIAGAGGAAHLPGMAAALTNIPVLGVPIPSKSMDGLDSLLSIAQMPAGVPVGTLAVGESGAKNAAYLAISILALTDPKIALKWMLFRKEQTQKILKMKIS